MPITENIIQKKTDFFIICLSILPIWFFDKENFFNLKIFLFFIFILILFYFFLRVCVKLNKFFYILFISTIIFYGLDSKIGFWIFFENQFFVSWEKYIYSFLFVILSIILIFLLLGHSEISKKIFLFSLFTLMIVNLAPNYFNDKEIYVIENLNIQKKNTVDKKKIIILHLDEMVGYNGIDEKIPYGKLAKKSYLNLFSKHNFEVFGSAYSIYNNTVDSIPNLLNFDFSTSKDYKSKFNEYVRWNSFDRKSKWKVVKNKFFENNKSKNIIASKEQSADFCYKYVNACLYSNHINTYNKYVELFKFGIKDYIFKKTYNQKTIFFYYFWRFTKTLEDKFDKKLFNDYHFFVFHKVKFENDLDNLVKLILYTNFDIYFSHLIFPHKPFTFEYDDKSNRCYFEENYINNFDYSNTKSLLQQHYKEIICTNLYLDNFFQKLKSNKNFENHEIILVSDTGTITNNKNMKGFYRDNYSVLYARKITNSIDFKINNEFVSSQELFSRHYNDNHNFADVVKYKNRIHLHDTNEFVDVNDFMNY